MYNKLYLTVLKLFNDTLTGMQSLVNTFLASVVTVMGDIHPILVTDHLGFITQGAQS